VSDAAVAFVPSAPLLVPQVAGGSAEADDDLRSASLTAVAAALNDAPEVVTVVAPVVQAGSWSEDATWSFAGFGVGHDRPDGSMVLPWQLGIGAWLLDECGWTGPRHYLGVDSAGSAEVVPADVGSVVVVADGSACRIDRAPGYLDERAESFDAHIAACLASGDVRGLAAIDRALAAELLCPSVPAWQWLATAVGGRSVSAASLLSAVAPYGVGYFAAVWTVDPH
jgi:hypothetical protein